MDEVLISADSHVSEPPDLWVRELPARFKEAAPRFAERGAGAGRFDEKPGGRDPNARLGEMAQDGVSAEVLYPTLGLRLFGLDDPELQEACFRLYNDWLIDYCRVAPDRLLGVACISAYRIDHAVAEMERCRKADLRGALVWQAPHPDLPFTSDHYERLWSAAEGLGMPVSLHILTGHNYAKNGVGITSAAGNSAPRGMEHYRQSVNYKTFDAANALYDFIFYGVLERHPRLKLVIVENEIGWIPFFLQQWDYYYRRFHESNPLPIERQPSEYFYRQVFATFFDDHVGTSRFPDWGVDNCMWSNDYPHPNSTWPRSREVIARDLGHLSAEVRAKLVCENVRRLYGMAALEPLAAAEALQRG